MTSVRGMRIRGRTHSEHGFVTVWTVFAASGVFLLLLGLVYDGGSALNDRLDAHRAAEQAARAGADQITGIKAGDEQIDLVAARRSVADVLSAAGWTGDVDVSGLEVTVTVIGRSESTFLGAVGISSFRVDESATATAIRSTTG